jgi:Ca-activated chloride channel family protein
MTRDTNAIQYRVFTSKSTGSTALYDAVVLGLNELKKSSLARKALLVVSDGGENNSRYSRGEVRKIVEETDALKAQRQIDDTNVVLARERRDVSNGILPAGYPNILNRTPW